MMNAANDNRKVLVANIDRAIAGQALTIRQDHRKFGRCFEDVIPIWSQDGFDPERARRG